MKQNEEPFAPGGSGMLPLALLLCAQMASMSNQLAGHLTAGQLSKAWHSAQIMDSLLDSIQLCIERTLSDAEDKPAEDDLPAQTATQP